MKKKTGLAEVAKKMLGKPISKKFQKSKWTLRPLSLPQQRYAALDAYILIDIMNALFEHSEKIGGPFVHEQI